MPTRVPVSPMSKSWLPCHRISNFICFYQIKYPNIFMKVSLFRICSFFEMEEDPFQIFQK
jgi:hypothetical protein